MPKSKRERKVTLSKTISKGRSRKESLLDQVRECVDQFSSAIVFTVDNMRGAALKQVRAHLKTSRLFFGRNKLMAAALGRTSSDEYRDNLHVVTGHLLHGGEAGIIFTDDSVATIRGVLSECQVPEFARAGASATRDVEVHASDISHFAPSMEPFLRKLGLPTRLTGGCVTLLGDYTVCKEGDVLRSEQAKLLQLLGIKMAVFSLSLSCCWSRDGSFEEYVERKPQSS